MPEKRSFQLGRKVTVTVPDAVAEQVQAAIGEMVGRRGGKGRRAGRGSAERLSVDRIVDVAIEQMRKGGYDAVTMRSIAKQLDTGPASLYAHVANREELDELVVSRVSAQLHVPDPDPERWDDQLREVAHDMRDLFHENPGVARAAMGMIPLQAGALVTMDRLLALLKAGGVPDQYAAWFCDLAALYVGALSVEEDIWRRREESGGTPAQHGDHADWVESFMASLPPEHFPTLVAMAPAMAAGSAEDRFSFGVDLLVEGLKSLSTRAAG